MDSDNNSDTEIKTIDEIKKQKKQSKLSEDTINKRKQNMLKAQQVRKEKYEEKKKEKNNIDLINNNIHSLLNNSESDSEKSVKTNKTNKIKDKPLEDDLKLMINKINNRVEKLYIMKKNKPPKTQPQAAQPIIISDNQKSLSILDSIRNKMLNQV